MMSKTNSLIPSGTTFLAKEEINKNLWRELAETSSKKKMKRHEKEEKKVKNEAQWKKWFGNFSCAVQNAKPSVMSCHDEGPLPRWVSRTVGQVLVRRNSRWRLGLGFDVRPVVLVRVGLLLLGWSQSVRQRVELGRRHRRRDRLVGEGWQQVEVFHRVPTSAFDWTVGAAKLFHPGNKVSTTF